MTTLSRPDATPPSPGEAARLEEVFNFFNQVSAELAQAYGGLQQQVAALTERLALLQEAMPAGVLVLDRAGRVVETNRTAVALMGLDSLGGLWSEWLPRLFAATATPGEYLLNRGGEEKVVALSTSADDSAGGRIVLLQDITGTHQLKTQAERHQRLAAMGEMAAQLAHQLRTPLAAALLYAGNLENATLPPERRSDLARKTMGRLRHLERLIQDVLLFARGEVLGRELMDLDALVAELRHTLDPIARHRGIAFESFGVDGQLRGNRKALMGALTNLLENAFDAVSKGGRVQLKISRREDAMEFLVSDDGPGVDTALLGRLFEPFFTTRTDGTGLGLAIAQGVARAHGGGIEVSSAPGQGTQFRFTVALGAETAAEGMETP